MTTQGLNTQPKQAWHPPPEGSPCFVEIPAQNVEKLKVSQSNTGKAFLTRADILYLSIPIVGMETSAW